jgi:SRSO17 transposase
VPDDVVFATKPHLAATMITSTVRAGTPARWVAGDEVYGADPHLRATCRCLGLGYVLAISCNRNVPTGAGPLRADRATGLLPPGAWARMSCGDGSKGRRWYSWAVLELQAEPDGPDLGSGHHGLLVWRNDQTGELAWYRCWTPRPVAIGDLVHVAGRRWTVEENFQAAKSHAGLDEHQVRRWDSWHRWTTLAMLAHAFLTILAVVMNDTEPADDTAGLIAITLSGARRLFAALAATVTTTGHVLAWSRWRRRHQHRARRAHYQRREGSITAAHRPDLRL